MRDAGLEHESQTRHDERKQKRRVHGPLRAPVNGELSVVQPPTAIGSFCQMPKADKFRLHDAATLEILGIKDHIDVFAAIGPGTGLRRNTRRRSVTIRELIERRTGTI